VPSGRRTRTEQATLTSAPDLGPVTVDDRPQFEPDHSGPTVRGRPVLTSRERSPAPGRKKGLSVSSTVGHGELHQRCGAELSDAGLNIGQTKRSDVFVAACDGEERSRAARATSIVSPWSGLVPQPRMVARGSDSGSANEDLAYQAVDEELSRERSEG